MLPILLLFFLLSGAALLRMMRDDLHADVDRFANGYRAAYCKARYLVAGMTIKRSVYIIIEGVIRRRRKPWHIVPLKSEDRHGDKGQLLVDGTGSHPVL